MKVIFFVFSVILLLLAGLCLEVSANLTLEQMQNKLNGATLISGVNIQKGDMSLAPSAKNAFRTRSKSEFILIRQFDATCGTTSAEMVLHYYGQDVGQQEIWDSGGVYVIEVGSFPSEIRQALNRLGVPAHWYHKASLEHLRHWVRQDRPPIVLLRFGEVLHYVVVVGYNRQGDFLLADPNYVFRWMSAADMRLGWSLNPPGLPNENYKIENGFESFALNILTRGVDVLTGGENVIVPLAPPNKRFPPNYNAVPILNGQFIDGGRAVRGGHRFNPIWKTDPWEETFTFTEDIVDYRVSDVVPAEFENLGGLEPAYIQGHQQIDKRTVKVWGRITPGAVTKGRIFVFVRGYKAPLQGGIKTVSSTQSQRYYSEWDIGNLDERFSWHAFTFPGDVVGYTISAGINFEDRFRAELVEHHKTGNQVKFKIMLKEHLIEKNGITVNVTAHYEPPVPGRFELSYAGSLLDIPSGQRKTLNVTVYSTNGHRMPGVSVQFLDTDNAKIAFSPTSVKTNNSGVATSTMKTGSSGNADFTIRVDGLSDEQYNVSIAKVLKEHVEKKWFSSDPIYCKKKFGGVCISWETDPYTSSHHIDVPSWVSIHTYSISTHVPVEDRLTPPSVKSHSRSGNRVNLRIRFERHALESNDILVSVHAKYWGSEPSPGAPLNPDVRPDPDTVTAAWQDLSYIPSHTTLLPNYPNPFNPETWIPYHLAESAEVTLRIYSAAGRLVRTLALGHQPAGIYENKSRAAYWDGRNTVGERVASGLYFYRFTAGDFTATGKMLILK